MNFLYRFLHCEMCSGYSGFFCSSFREISDTIPFNYPARRAECSTRFILWPFNGESSPFHELKNEGAIYSPRVQLIFSFIYSGFKPIPFAKYAEVCRHLKNGEVII